MATNYETALCDATDELSRLKTQRDDIDTRIARLESAIAGLNGLLGRQRGGEQLGMTTALRTVLKAATEPMSLNALRCALDSLGFDLSGYSQPLPTIATAVKRLVDRAEAEQVESPSGTCYRWKSQARTCWPLHSPSQPSSEPAPQLVTRTRRRTATP
jgi:ABC-type transporter Mla subunit MlaD